MFFQFYINVFIFLSLYNANQRKNSLKIISSKKIEKKYEICPRNLTFVNIGVISIAYVFWWFYIFFGHPGASQDLKFRIWVMV